MTTTLPSLAEAMAIHVEACRLKQVVNRPAIVAALAEWMEAIGAPSETAVVFVSVSSEAKSAARDARDAWDARAARAARDASAAWAAWDARDARAARDARDARAARDASAAWAARAARDAWDFSYTSVTAIGALALSDNSTARIWLPCLQAFAAGAHLVWIGDRTVYVAVRPSVIETDARNRLHCETGPAFVPLDDVRKYYWHGVMVPAHWIEDRANLHPQEVIAAKNVEQRAAGAAIVGWSKMLSALKCEVIDDSGSPDIGQLIELKLPGLREAGRFLKAECPRNGTIVEGVPRVSDIDGLPINTALAAQAWRIGDPQSEYSHPPKRT